MTFFIRNHGVADKDVEAFYEELQKSLPDKIIYVTNPDGPQIYQLDGEIINEDDARKMIDAGEVQTDWCGFSNGLV